MAPADLFAAQGTESEQLALDARCQALHLNHFASYASAPRESWLFLNISPAMVVSGRYAEGGFTEELERTGVNPASIVVEILEDAISRTDSLVNAVTYFRELGCLIALDDFGTGHSNFERIWRLQPDITKLDRSIIAQASAAKGTRGQGKILRNLVSLMHEAGSLVLAEGVETEEEALICFDADADFVQGYYFAHPAIAHDPEEIAHAECLLATISQTFNEQESAAASRQRELLAPYETAFRASVEALAAGDIPEEALEQLLEMPRTVRCYLLNGRGEQISNHFAPESAVQEDARFDPLFRTAGGAWFRRPYYRHAIGDPNRLKVSAPYLSTTGTHMCRTLSIARHDGVETWVFCCDLLWDDQL